MRETPQRHLDLGFRRARARPDARATIALVRSRARPFVRTFMTTSREDARDAPRRCGAGGPPLERDTDGSPGARHSWRGRARVNANRNWSALRAPFRLVDRHTTTLVRGEQGCVRLAVIPQVSAPRDAQGVVHSGYTRRCRHDEVRALALPFSPSSPSFDPPRVRPLPRPSRDCVPHSAHFRASAHLRAADFRVSFPPLPPAGSISARWRRVTGARRPRRASAREARRRSSPAPTRPSARSRRR